MIDRGWDKYRENKKKEFIIHSLLCDCEKQIREKVEKHYAEERERGLYAVKAEVKVDFEKIKVENRQKRWEILSIEEGEVR